VTETAKNYDRIANLDQLKRLTDKLIERGDPIGFDVETGYVGQDREKGSLDITWSQQFICGFSITNDKRWARYVPIGHDFADNLPEEQAWEVVKPALETLTVVAHNLKFEQRNLRMLEAKGRGPRIEIAHGVCTMIQAFVLSNWRAVNLKDLTKWIFDHDQAKIETLFPGLTAKQMRSLRFNILDLSPEVISYACEDAAWALALHERNEPLVLAERKQTYTIDSEVAEVVSEMEDWGMAVAWDEMAEERSKAIPFRDKMEKAVKAGLSELSGRDLTTFSLNSPKQVKELLYRDLGYSTTRRTKGADSPKNAGKEAWELMSTDAVAMEGLAKKHSAVKKILELREVGNALNRFDKWLDEHHYAEDQRVHPNFNQVVVGTGRFAANDPPVQQMPKEWRWTTRPVNAWKKEEWEEVVASGTNHVDYWTGNFRDYVKAPDGWYLLGYDYSQIELRVLAGVSQEPVLLDAFENNKDVHTITAAMMLGKSPAEVDPKTERPIGKTMNFALLYQMGPQSLSERLAIPRERANELYAAYFAQFASISTWMQKAKELGKSRGFAETPFGRKYTVWELEHEDKGVRAKGERVLINAPIQGGAADYMKMAMVRARRALQKAGLWGTKAMMVHNLHDALMFEVHNSVDPREIREILQAAVVFPIPKFPKIVADWELGQRHGSCKPWKDEDVRFDEEAQQWVIVDQEEGEAQPLPSSPPTLVLVPTPGDTPEAPQDPKPSFSNEYDGPERTYVPEQPA
jgi:DNA polymerase-1